MILASPRPELSIPDTTLSALVLPKRGRQREKTALIDAATGRSLTFGELETLAARCAAGLIERGFRRGDVLALFSPNTIDYPIAFHGAALAGGATTTINPLYTTEEAARQLVDSRARILVAAPGLVEKALPAAKAAGIEQVFVLGEGGGLPGFDLLLRPSPLAHAVEVDPREAVVALPYSSGTTGLPKGVMLTHRNLVANVLQLADTGHFGADDVYVCVLPMFHIYGLVAITSMALHLGATTIVVQRFELASLLATMSAARVTAAHLVPPIVLQLAKHACVDPRALPDLRLIFSGAAPLSSEVSEACAQRLSVRVIQGYGMTEASPATHVSPVDPRSQKPGSVGVLVASTQGRIVDPETGRDAAPGERGEIWVRGPQVMKGYLNRPDATAATVDAEGWLHTGDVGIVDADGQCFVVDRIKELIKYKGLQIAPAELEAVLLAHPAVADAAVIPVPDEEAGEVPKAFVVRKAAVEAAELQAWVALRVAPHKRLRELEFVDAIPKSASGKLLRRVLIDQERARRAR